MQGALGQVLALAMRANAALGGRDIGPLWRAADAFRFCREVRFALPGPAEPRVVASDPDEWIASLAGCGALGVKVRAAARGRADALATVALVGGGADLMLEVVLSGQSRWWWPDWRLVDGADPWAVTYWRIDPPEPVVPDRDVRLVAADVGAAIGAVADFAAACAPLWERQFRLAAAVLEGREPSLGMESLVPPGLLSTEAERLFDACRAAWQFGGMGAWNDGTYAGDREEEGDRLSARLFALLHEGLAAAANSSFPAAAAPDAAGTNPPPRRSRSGPPAGEPR